MIDVSEVVVSEEFAQPFTILRGPGQWVNGVWVSSAAPVDGFGVITVAEARDLEMVPQGDIVHGAMVFHSAQPLYGTHADSTRAGASSDILVWRGLYFRVLSVTQLVDYGFWRAVATRLSASGQKLGG